jgi:formylmethanofuran dehydrogenase subunit D
MTQFLSNFDQNFTPSQEFTDPVGKFRVSQPVALIDTDFEYGTQGTKWESLSMTNNRPFAYSSALPLKNITSMSMPVESSIVTVDLTVKTNTVNNIATSTPATGYVTYTTATDHGFVIGEWVNITNVTAAYTGLYQILEVASATTFAVANTATSSALDQSGTAVSGYAPPNGSIIYVVDTLFKPADGTYSIATGGGTAQFTYYATAQNTTSITSIVDSTKTSIFAATAFATAAIGTSPTVIYDNKKITVTTSVPHGLSIGNEIALTGTTASTNAPNGSWTVASVLSPTIIEFYVNTAPTGTIAGTAKLFARPQGTFAHRPFDGGVIFSTNGNSNNQQAIRQTRRYFRYQSGKGIQYSSGSLVKPSFQLDRLTCVGDTITIQTKEQHNLIPGAQINIINATTTLYNGTYTVDSVLTYNKFTVKTAVALPATATGRFYITVSSWTGSVVRLGLFDEQNGIFFEFDGTTLYAVQRNSTYQVAGRVTVTNGGNTVAQTGSDFPTSFTNQLDPGDYIVLRGQSYKVLSIESDTSLTISPSYKGVTTTNVTMSKTFEKRIPQSEWNIDKMDGTGYSGYTVDLNRMQMFYIDYSWYGAGAIRWGFRGTDGEITYVHKEKNNNVNLEAYMRSGNLPARYETNTVPVYTKITSTLSTSATTLSVASTASFKNSGTITVRSGTKVEIMNYSSKTATAFNGITRAKQGNPSVTLTIALGSSSGTVATIGDLANVQIGQRVISGSFPTGTFVTNISGSVITFSKAATTANPTGVTFAPMSAIEQSFTYSATAPVIVENAYPEFSPTVSHWGTSVIMDGGYDDDKSLVFTYGQRSTITIAAGDTRSLFSIRVAPSVDNGLTAEYGGREIVNRMQLILRSLEVSSRTSGNFLVRAVLNGIPASTQQWTDAIGGVGAQANSSLAQVADYSNRDIPIFGGEIVAGYFVSGTGSLDLSLVRELGNSILGGGSNNVNEQIYPDGPDVLTIVVTNVGATGSAQLLGRISWTEAQA